jgi:integrase
MTLRFSKLDRPAIRRLKPGEAVTEHGITAERLPDGDARYSVNVMVDGQRIHRVIGRESENVTRTQCEEFIEQARGDARKGRLNLPAGRKPALTFAAAAVASEKRIEEEGGKNLKIKRRHLRMYLTPFFGTMRLDAISDFTVGRYRKGRAEAQASPATINREMATLSHLLGKAIAWKWIDRVPCRPRKEREGQGRIVALTDEQCEALMKAAIAGADPDCWLFVAFGLNTAMRHSEMLRARWEHLDLDNLRLFVPDAKAGERDQPITPELAAVLRKEREMRNDRRGWIFPALHRDSKSGHRARMDRSFRDAVTAAELDPKTVTPHVMPHHRPCASRRRSPNHPAHQRPQDAGDGAALRPRARAAYRPRHPSDRETIAGTPGEQNAKRSYTGNTSALCANPARNRPGERKRPTIHSVRAMEAGSGIEPLYEDLQSGTTLGVLRISGPRVAFVLHRAENLYALGMPRGRIIQPSSSGAVGGTGSTSPGMSENRCATSAQMRASSMSGTIPPPNDVNGGLASICAHRVDKGACLRATAG